MKEVLVRNRIFGAGHLPLIIDYSNVLVDLIKQGKYDEVHPGIIAKNFSLPTNLLNQKKNVITRLFCFNDLLKSEEVEEKIKETSYELADLYTLLIFGKKYPNLQRAFSIIGLGAICHYQDDSLYVPGLSKSVVGSRKLNLYSYQGIWPSTCRFLAIRS